MTEVNKSSNHLLLILLLIIIGSLIVLNFFQNKSQIDLAIKSLEMAQKEIEVARSHVDSAKQITASLKTALGEYKGYVDSVGKRVEKLNVQHQNTTVVYQGKIGETRESYKKLKKELTKYIASEKTEISIDTIRTIQ